jgi:hypothetical protein
MIGQLLLRQYAHASDEIDPRMLFDISQRHDFGNEDLTAWRIPTIPAANEATLLVVRAITKVTDVLMMWAGCFFT